MISEFLTAMAESGCSTDSQIYADDKLRRAHAVGDSKTKLNISYRFCIEGDFAFGWWRDHRGGLTHKWYYKKPNMTAEEHKAIQAKIAERSAAAEKELRRAAQAARKACEGIWQRGVPCSDHPYLKRKGVRSLGGLRSYHGALLVPAFDKKGISTLQFISESGEKRFKKDATKKGTRFTIPGSKEIVGICEGYATGATVHEATGWQIEVVFDSGNLKDTISIIRREYPESTLVICADNDQFVFRHGKRPDGELPAGDDPKWIEWREAGLLYNVGFEAARAALKTAGGKVEIKTPKFKILTSRPTDFNDLHALEGLDAVRAQVLTEEKEEPIFQDIPFEPPEDMSNLVPCYDAEDTEPPITQGPFKIMGYNGGTFYYLPRDAGQLVQLSASAHTEQNLLQLAPLEWWRERFGNKKGISWSHVRNALIQTCYSRKVFTMENRIRGCGIWRDKGRVVAHLGDHLLVDGKPKEMFEIGSAFVYEKTAPIFEVGKEPLDDIDAQKLMKICDLCTFSNPLSSVLLAGWLVIAPFCGMIDWRPHIWIDGEAEAGKSYVMNKIIKRVLGNMALRVGSGSSEAGLRRTMGFGARPILMDEMESETERDQELLKSVLMLARKSSSGEKMIQADTKGSGTVEYNIFSMFCMSSINSSVKERADQTRFSHLHLKRNTHPDAAAHFRDLKLFVDETLTEEYGKRLLARTIANIDVLIKNANTFNEAAESVLKMRRAGDQIGPLLAGAYLLHTTREVSPEEALSRVERHEWHEYTAVNEQSDQERLFGFLMTSRLNVVGTSRRHETQIGKAIETAIGWDGESNYTSSEARAALEAIDIKIRGDEVWIRKPSQHISRILRGTPWHASWADKLAEIEGVTLTKSPKREGSSSAHQVIIEGKKFRERSLL